MDRNLLVRMAGAGVLVASLIAIAMTLRDCECGTNPPNTHETSSSGVSTAELARCQAIGLEAATDDACRQIWAKNRDRFFDVRRTHQDLKLDLFPSLSGDDHLPAAVPAKPAMPDEGSAGWHR
ncbi:conjugative transfer region protein TrbK [Rhizobiales bacterium GAS188]|nr:conjugative transfer region protein TrbK [Rhizobiales bacterium GAS188]